MSRSCRGHFAVMRGSHALCEWRMTSKPRSAESAECQSLCLAASARTALGCLGFSSAGTLSLCWGSWRARRRSCVAAAGFALCVTCARCCACHLGAKLTAATPLPRFLTGMLPGPPGSSGKPNWSCPQTSEADRDSRTSESGETSVLWPSAMYSEVHAVSPRRAVTQRFYLLSISWDALLQGTRKCHAF